MNKMQLAMATLAWFMVLSACSTSGEHSWPLEPLNILLITADDLNYNSVGAYG